MVAFFQRIESDLETIREIVKDEYGVLGRNSAHEIRVVLIRLARDVQTAEREEQRKERETLEHEL